MWSVLPLRLAAPQGAAPKRHLVGVGVGGDETAQKQQRLSMSGSDVLMALQRAAANKYKDKRATRNDDNAAAAAAAGGENKQSSTNTIKPLCINPQWSHQLHQLEIRLHQLPRA